MNQRHHRLSPIAISTSLRAASSAFELLSVADYWSEFDEPTDSLKDSQATFAADGIDLLRLCLANGIAYRPASAGLPMAFPIWLFREFYEANP